jgi:feruloyl-CoA synthase
MPACLIARVAAYSTVSQDYDKLRHVLDTLTPAWSSRRRRALRQGHRGRGGPDVEVVLASGSSKAARPRLRDLLATHATPPSTPPCRRPARKPS